MDGFCRGDRDDKGIIIMTEGRSKDKAREAMAASK